MHRAACLRVSELKGSEEGSEQGKANWTGIKVSLHVCVYYTGLRRASHRLLGMGKGTVYLLPSKGRQNGDRVT